MKLIMENWRKYLNEGWDRSSEKEFGPKPEDLECFKFYKTYLTSGPYTPGRSEAYEKFKTCMDNLGYSWLGFGSYRLVFEIKDKPDYVLKIAIGGNNTSIEKSKWTNKQEAKLALQFSSDLAVRVYASAEDFSWIISEKVNTIKSWEEMEKFFPVWMEVKSDPNFRLAFQNMFGSFHDFLTHSCVDSEFFRKSQPSGWSEYSDDAESFCEGQMTKKIDTLSELVRQNGGDVGWTPSKEEIEKEEGRSMTNEEFWAAERQRSMNKLMPALEKLISDPRSMFTKVREFLSKNELSNEDIRPANVGYVKGGRYVILDPALAPR